MTKKLLLLAALTMVLGSSRAQGPNNSGRYYQAATGKSGEALKTALFNIISKKQHSPSYDELLELYKKTDTRADGYVRDWYSNITSFTHIEDKAGNYSKEGDVYNREHTVPQSWGAPKADIVHVVPTDGWVNNIRGSLPFAEVSYVEKPDKDQSANGYSKRGPSKTAGYSGMVFEPNDEVKGDLARIYFYMATCYEGTITSWSGGGVITGTKYQPYVDWTFDMMMRWSKLDPIDDVERARNAAIAANDVQGNRNPFVDYPGLEEYIWGDKKDEVFSYDNYQGGGGEVSPEVAMPTFEPEEGTYYDRVEVTITTATEDATIYYTTNGVEPSENSRVYEGPFELTASATVKAIAVKDGVKSYQNSAVYTIVNSGTGEEEPAEGTILLCNALFGTNYEGSILKSDNQDLVGTQDGVTVVYSLGSGDNRYVNDSQIRLYQKNTLTVSVATGHLEEIEFTLAKTTSKTLSANVGTVSDLTWTGNAQSVVFSVDEGSGNMQLKSMRVKRTGTTDIDMAQTHTGLSGQRVVYNLRGQRVANPTHGLYIVDGKKVFIR